MASGEMLPTYQRYVNGIPLPVNRRTLRIREKYFVFLVLICFGSVCFGAFFFLPDLRERLSVDDFKKQLGQAGGDIFLPKADVKIAGRIFMHDLDQGADSRKVRDKLRLHEKIEWDKAQHRALENMRIQMNLTGKSQDQQRLIIGQNAAGEDTLNKSPPAQPNSKNHSKLEIGLAGRPVEKTDQLMKSHVTATGNAEQANIRRNKVKEVCISVFDEAILPISDWSVKL